MEEKQENPEVVKTAVSYQRQLDQYRSYWDYIKEYFRMFYVTFLLVALSALTWFICFYSLKNFQKYGDILYNLSFLTITAGMFMAAIVENLSNKELGEMKNYNFTKPATMFVLSGIIFLIFYLTGYSEFILQGLGSEAQKKADLMTLFFMPYILFLVILVLFQGLLFPLAILETLYSLFNTNHFGGGQKTITTSPRSPSYALIDKIPGPIKTLIGLTDSKVYRITPSNPRGDYVKRKRVAKMADALDGSDAVQYLTDGGYVEIITEELERNKLNAVGVARVAYTDDRVVYKVPRLFGSHKGSIHYQDIEEVDKNEGIITKNLVIKTEYASYTIEVVNPGKSEFRELVDYLKTEADGQ